MGSVQKVYLYGSEFVVLADNNSLTYVLTSAKLDAAGHRWLAAFSTYNFSIKCLANKDGLSRRPNGPPHEDVAFLEEKKRIEGFKMHVLDHDPHEAISAVHQRHFRNSSSDESDHSLLVESLGFNASAISDHFADPGQDLIIRPGF